MAKRESRAPADAGAIQNVELPDDTGQSVRLGSLWEEGPAVLVWLRHYG